MNKAPTTPIKDAVDEEYVTDEEILEFEKELQEADSAINAERIRSSLSDMFGEYLKKLADNEPDEGDIRSSEKYKKIIN